MAKKTGIRTNSGMMIGHGTMTTIGWTKIDATIIDGMIDMMITSEMMMIVEMIIVRIIIIAIIHQEKTEDQTKRSQI